jgi:hypothetical protein
MLYHLLLNEQVSSSGKASGIYSAVTNLILAWDSDNPECEVSRGFPPGKFRYSTSN